MDCLHWAEDAKDPDQRVTLIKTGPHVDASGI
jgi:hypothetical protein